MEPRDEIGTALQMLTIIALGDSTTAGTPGFTSPLEAPPHGAGNPESQYSYWLAASHPDWRVLNRGINGERSDEIAARFGRDVIDERRAADDAARFLVVIIAGVNDIYRGHPAQTVQHHLQWMYESAQTAGIPVVAGSILPYNTATAEQNQRMHAVNRWIVDYAATHPAIAFCDTRSAVAAGGRPDLLADSPDGLHPSPDGYRQMALALEGVILSFL
jgi:lysophospholipase L1-like esterase